MESVAQSYLKAQAEVAERVLGDAVRVLHQGGDHRAASSLDDVLNVLQGRARVFEEPVPGLHALMRLAGIERHNPHGMLPGEHARLVFAGGSSVTGVWCYDEPTEEWPVGRAYLVRDDNGEEHPVGGGYMQIQPLWLDLNQRDRADTLARAVTVIGSAWVGSRALRGAEHDELIKHEHIDYEQPVDATYARREHRRRCECGEPAQLRVVAWAPGPNTEAPDGNEFAGWSKPAEYAEETVCSAACAEHWGGAYVTGAAELLGEETALQLRLNIEPWSYDPVHEDLPAALAEAQSAAAAASYLVQKAARSWFDDRFDAAASQLGNARASATLALSRIAELEPVERGPRVYTAGDPEPDFVVTVRSAAGVEYVSDPVHRLWMLNWRGSGEDVGTTWPALLAAGDVTAERAPELLPSSTGMHPRDVPVDVWLQMCAPLVAQILDDPHRYEVIDGGSVVYDRQNNQLIDGRTGLHARQTERDSYVYVGPVPVQTGTMGTTRDYGKFHVYDGSEWKPFDTIDEADEYRKTLLTNEK